MRDGVVYAPRAVRPLRTRVIQRLKESLIALAFVVPNLFVIAVFVYRPLIINFYYSTLSWQLGSSSAVEVGLANYVEWLHSPDTVRTLLITLIFSVVTVLAVVGFGLLVGLALNQKIPGAGFVRGAVFAPYVLSGVGIGLVWLFIFDPTIGALGAILRYIHIPSPHWYSSGPWALVMVIIVYVWQHTGYAAIIYLAGLQAIPAELLESAALDGAAKFARFRNVVWPLLSPTTFFILVTITLNSLRQFDIIKIMTDGGPDDATSTLVFQVYEQAFANFRAGYSSTVAVVLFIIMVIIAILQLRFVERGVHYA